MLEARALTKRFPTTTAVDEVSFTVKRYEVLGYLGPNGSGKSTTVNMITGLLEPTRGQVLFDGRSIQSQLIEYKRRLGYVPEQAHLYPHLTGREYLQLAGRLRGLAKKSLDRKIDDLLQLFGLGAARHSPIGSYSKGMRQKVLISAALLHNPDILVFDEPMSGLDVTTGLVFRDLVKSLAREGKIILYSSHVLEVVEKVCTNVMILRKGRIAANDTVEGLRTLMKSSSLARGYFFGAGAGAGHGDNRELDCRRDEERMNRVGFEQFTTLVRHFFGRFFDNEFVAKNSDMQVTVVKLLALLSSPGMILPCLRYTAYLDLARSPDAVRNPMLWSDRTLYFSFSMLVMGAVTVLEWDTLFPDRRDYGTLMVLPIRARTIFLAKVGALTAVSAGVHGVGEFRLGGDVSRGVVTGPGARDCCGRSRRRWDHAILASSAFAFLFLVALEGVLLNVLSVRWFRRMSAYVQGAMVFVLLWLFCLFPHIAATVAELKAQDSWVLKAFPPLWFLGLNEMFLGTRDAAFLALAHRAEIGLGVVALLAAVAYTVAYRRHVRRTLESTEGGEATRTAMHERIGRAADRIAPDRVERAVLAFIGKTMARSGKHRIFLAAYAGAGFALAAQVLSADRNRDVWLSLPLVLGFFVLSGMRFIFTIPSELPANWQFRVSDTDRQRSALNGTRTALRWFGVAPLFVALAPVYFVLWKPGVALAHLLFSVTISILLIEVLVMEFRKIPFTCSYPPGKANVTLLWIAYWVAFLLYAFAMARLESWMVNRPWRLAPFYLAAAMVLAGFEAWRRRADRVGVALVFDDAADPAVLTLGLGELAWTRTATSRVEGAVRRPSASPVE